MGRSRRSLSYFRPFHNCFYRKIVDFSGIRARVIGIEGEHADHLIATTAQFNLSLDNYITRATILILKKCFKTETEITIYS